jgi:hypothetical protein
MDKAAYGAPQGLGDMPDAEEVAVEFELESELEEGGPEAEMPAPPSHDANLVDTLEESVVVRLRGDVLEDVRNDINGRKDWEDTLTDGIKLLGMRYEEMSEPWDGACGVFHPVLGEATVRFQSEAVMETFPAGGPVKTAIIGQQTPEKLEAAKRVREDMNYQLTEVMSEYRAEHERMLFSLAPMGCAFKKIYYDTTRGRPAAPFVPAEDIILPYGVTQLSAAQRITHRMRKTKNDLMKLMDSGFYKKIELTDPTVKIDEMKQAKDDEMGIQELNPSLFTLYEVHGEYVVEEGDDGDEIAAPYVITILEDTDEILSIRRNWLEGDVLKLPRQHFVKYDYIPGFGAYGFGLIHLIGGFAKSATSILRQLVDAGTLSNLPGGFKAQGARVKDDQTPIAPGEFRDMDVPSGTIKDNIIPLPYKEPSTVLAGLLDKIIEDARRFASTADLDVSDMSAQAPVGTTMALLERMLKVMSAVQARVHYSFKQELKLLAGIIRDYAPDEYDYDPENAPRGARKSDYEYVEIIPVSDPNASTMSQRIVMWQAVMQLAEKAPQLYDQRELHRQVLETFGVPNIAKLLPGMQELPALDPVTENMNALNGKPMKAHLHQDHNAHLMVHNNMLQDPMIQQQIGQNPQAQMIMGALMAHITEHVAFQYRQQLEKNLGVALPPPDQPLPPEVEVKLAPLIAQASQMLLAQDQIAAAQQQQQQMLEDPMYQLEKEKNELKRLEIERKEQDSVRDYNVAQGKLAVERARLGSDVELKGIGMGVDLAKAKMQADAAARKAAQKPAPKAKTAK